MKPIVNKEMLMDSLFKLLEIPSVKTAPVGNMPFGKGVFDALDYYFKQTGRRYYIEYSLILGENDTDECALELKKLFAGKPCHINLIRLNSVKERNLIGTSDKGAKAFMEKLEKLGLSVTLRRKMGNDIEGACGQLRRKFIQEGGDSN